MFGIDDLFSRKKTTANRSKSGVSDGTDNVTVIINTDDIKRSAAKKRSAPKRKPAAKKAAPKKAAPKKRTVAKKRTVKKTAPKPAAKKKAPAKRRAPACAKSNVLEKRKATRKRKRERERPIAKEAFRSTKVRLGMADGEVADVEMLMDCLYSEHETPAEGMADKEPTDGQIKKLNRINERLRELELLLGEKYRAGYSSRNERGYVLRKYVGVDERIETWGDPYIARRPVGIGGKTLERVFLKKHGLSWEDFAKESASIRELRSKIEKHNGVTTSAERKKQEAIVLKERQKEERKAAKLVSTAKTKNKQRTEEKVTFLNKAEELGESAYKKGIREPIKDSRLKALYGKYSSSIDTSQKAWEGNLNNHWIIGYTKAETEDVAKAAKAQEAKAEKAEKVAKVAKAKAKKEPTKTNKAAAQAAEKKAVMEEKKVEKIEKEVEKLEVKAEKAEAKAEVAESNADDLANDPRMAVLEKLEKKYG